MENLMETKFISPWITTQVKAAKAKIWLMTGKKATLSQWISDCELKVDGDYTILREAENIMFARILMAKDRLDESLRYGQRHWFLQLLY